MSAGSQARVVENFKFNLTSISQICLKMEHQVSTTADREERSADTIPGLESATIVFPGLHPAFDITLS